MGLLSIEMGRLSIPAETCLFSLLSQCFTKIKDIFNLGDPSAILAEQSTLERILNSVFDTTTLPFVTEKSIRIAAGLDDHDKSCLFVQAVAGLVLVFRHLDSAGTVLSASMLSRELQLFAESEQRRAALDKIGGSSLFGSCYTKSCIVDFVMAVIDEDEVEHHDGLTFGTTGKDLSGDNAAWVNDRPCKKMGLPWGFTIMALN
jgi:hypothetical protein